MKFLGEGVTWGPIKRFEERIARKSLEGEKGVEVSMPEVMARPSGPIWVAEEKSVVPTKLGGNAAELCEPKTKFNSGS